MDFLSNPWMQLAGRMLSRELDRLSPEAKKALERMQVNVARQPDRIVISVDAGGDAAVEKAGAVMLDALLAPVSRIAALFGCRVNVEQSGRDEGPGA